MIDIDDLVEKSWKLYHDALSLLDRGDYIDAAEKAWGSIEFMRKALLVSLGMSREKIGNLALGLPLFIKVLKVLERRHLIDLYYKFDSLLHVKGFYEMIIPPDEIEAAIEEVKEWLKEVELLARKLNKFELKEALKLMESAFKIKRKLIQESVKYDRLLRKIEDVIKIELKLKEE